MHKRSVQGPDTEPQDVSLPFIKSDLQRTAGPYSWVIFDRDAGSSMSRHVGCTPKSGSKVGVLASAMTGHGGLMMLPGA